jgi:hypothetical protein
MQVLPENILKAMSPEDRRRYAKGQMTATEAEERFCEKEEKVLRKQLIAWLRRNDIDYCSPRTDKKTGILMGISDFFIWKGTKFCFVELKSEEGKLKPEQLAFTQRQIDQGTPILVTRSLSEACGFIRRSLFLD